jgi:hypothetical protein
MADTVRTIIIALLAGATMTAAPVSAQIGQAAMIGKSLGSTSM